MPRTFHHTIGPLAALLLLPNLANATNLSALIPDEAVSVNPALLGDHEPRPPLQAPTWQWGSFFRTMSRHRKLTAADMAGLTEVLKRGSKYARGDVEFYLADLAQKSPRLVAETLAEYVTYLEQQPPAVRRAATLLLGASVLGGIKAQIDDDAERDTIVVALHNHGRQIEAWLGALIKEARQSWPQWRPQLEQTPALERLGGAATLDELGRRLREHDGNVWRTLVRLPRGVLALNGELIHVTQLPWNRSRPLESGDTMFDLMKRPRSAFFRAVPHGLYHGLKWELYRWLERQPPPRPGKPLRLRLGTVGHGNGEEAISLYHAAQRALREKGVKDKDLDLEVHVFSKPDDGYRRFKANRVAYPSAVLHNVHFPKEVRDRLFNRQTDGSYVRSAELERGLFSHDLDLLDVPDADRAPPLRLDYLYMNNVATYLAPVKLSAADRERVQGQMRRAAAYLGQLLRPGGQFHYFTDVDIDPGVEGPFAALMKRSLRPQRFLRVRSALSDLAAAAQKRWRHSRTRQRARPQLSAPRGVW